MSTTLVRQTFFSGGQIDKINWKRTDINDYLTCAQVLLNCEVGTTGLAKKRKGTIFNQDVSFAIPTSQLYEFVDQYGNFYIFVSTTGGVYIFSVTSDGTVAPYPAAGFNNLGGMPYQPDDWPLVDYSLTNDSLVLAHPLYPPARIYASSYTSDLPTFAYQVLNIYPIPPFDFGTVVYSGFTVAASVTSGVLTFQFTGVGADPGFTSAWVGGVIIGLGSSVTSPLGSALITDVGYSSSGSGTVTFHGIVTNPFTSNFPITGSQYSIQQPSWSGTLGYPGVCLFYQNRLWFANTPSLPATIFGSKINAPANFDVGVGLDTDAIIYTIGQNDAIGILWLNGGKQLEIYTANYEFAAPQEQNIGLTPGTFSIRLQSSFGASKFMKPITYLNDSYYITRSGNSLMNFHFDGIGQTYTSSNISALSQGLVINPINRSLMRGSSSTQDNFIYFVNSDNTVTTFQFNYGTKLAALTQTQFQLDINGDPTVNILDTVSVNNIIFFLKYYPANGTYTLESFNDSVWLDGWTTQSMPNTGIITGLNQYEGLYVEVVYNNQDFGSYLVSGNQITCAFPQAGTVNVQVGYMYSWLVQTMYLFAGANQSNYYKQIERIFVDYYNTIGLVVNDTLVNYQNYEDIMAGLPLQYKTDTAVIDSVDGWNRFATVTLSQNVPFDCQILAIAYQIDAKIV